MKKRWMCMLIVALFLMSGSQIFHASIAQAVHGNIKLNITGEIAKSANGYIIRGQKPAEVFTILNADEKILDKFIKEGKIVEIEVRSVSGDNVEILKIDGKEYGKGTQ